MPHAVRYVVGLPVSFDQGSGWTKLVSREDMQFTTTVPLTAGQRITGMIRFRESGRRDLVLHYVARVIFIQSKGPDQRRFDVLARFETFHFLVEG